VRDAAGSIFDGRSCVEEDDGQRERGGLGFEG